MIERLNCWIEGEFVGRFERDESAAISFVYEGTSDRVVSLSLPRESRHQHSAASHFLDALAPETVSARDALMTYSGAKSRATWHLLEAAGGDVAGGLVLLAQDELPDQQLSLPRLAREDNIARRVMEVRRVPAAAFTSDVAPIRYALAGAQGKFAMALIQGDWYWPNAAHPSTHIFKPSAEAHPGLDELEAETLRLARLVGIESPNAEVMKFVGQETFAIERFDRVIREDEYTTRLHAEDLTQALGVGVDRKYQVSVPQITRALRGHTGENELGYEFFRQLIFNVTIGNADAHAKNYTLMHGADGSVRMSPLYDAIPMGLVPGEYSMDLSMRIGHAKHFNAVTPDIWRSAARKAGLEPERVTEQLTQIAGDITEHLDETIGRTERARHAPEKYDAIRRSAELALNG